MEHKYQWSLFPDPMKNEQFVVRCDDEQEFLEGIHLVRQILSQRAEQEPDLEPEPQIPPDQCTLHNVSMKKRTSKNGAIHWYDHRWQEDGVWHVCNGKVVKTQ